MDPWDSQVGKIDRFLERLYNMDENTFHESQTTPLGVRSPRFTFFAYF
jgi:hypothetical protein